jgi:glycerol-3-phosphate O-acyltransferase/dihydroxyacetone phosphate acyltransferase
MIQWLTELLVRVFFRRAVLTGAEHVPRGRPMIMVVNHPNALVDPLLVLALVPRPVVFLAKEPLFRMPVLGTLARALGCIPVYRRQDAADTLQNRRTFQQVVALLGGGGAVALFPEGTSHSDPALRPLKTGAARMALEAAAAHPGAGVVIVPAGLYYTDKAVFRSSALLNVGEAIPVRYAVPLPDGTIPPAAVHALTAAIDAALRQLTLDADAQEGLDLVVRAERIFSAGAVAAGTDRDLAAQFQLRQRFLAGYAALRQRDPERLERLTALVRQVDADLAALSVSPESLLAVPRTPGGGYSMAAALLPIGLLLPLALPGLALHYPAYRLTGTIMSRAVTVEPDVIATGKLLAAMLLFPITWFAAAATTWGLLGSGAALIVLVAAPFSGLAALRMSERATRLLGVARGTLLRLLRRRSYRGIAARRERVRAEILELAGTLAAP